MNTKNTSNLEGFYSINKPEKWTSHDVVNKLRGITKIKKIGHAGTLDPLATGVLIVAIGKKYTKQISTIVSKEKEYIAEITLGATSDTDDADGKITKQPTNHPPTPNTIKNELQSFIGLITQIPPQYSAIKIKGQKAYSLARKGIKTNLTPRTIHIKNITIISYTWPVLTIKVTCGAGVYIRSLARDLGKKLKTGGYITKLTRTKIGEFTLEKSFSLIEFEKHIQEKKANLL